MILNDVKSIEIQWSVPKLDGMLPSARGGHSMIVLDMRIIIFGGHYFGSHGSFVYLNDMYSFDIMQSSWSELKPSTSLVPTPRYYHSAILLNGKTRMFIFGGKGPKNQFYRDMYYFDIKNLTWYAVQWTTESPSGRFGHTVASIDDQKILLFGGWDGKVSCANTMWVFDTHSFTWSKLKCNGKAPMARQNHSMISKPRTSQCNHSYIIVYGGITVLADTDPVYHNDLYILDMRTYTWSRPRIVGDYPIGTFSQTLAIHQQYIFLFGGWSGTERSPLYMGDKRVHDILENLARENRLKGGSHNQDENNTKQWNRNDEKHRLKSSSSYVRALDLEGMSWSRPCLHGSCIENRYGHSLTIVGSKFFIFGGWDGNRALNELVMGELLILP